MPPLNPLKERGKPQPLEMGDDYIRGNLSQQELMHNSTNVNSPNAGPDPVVVVPSSSSSVSRNHIIIVAVLCYVNLINYMDRYTVAGLLYDISNDFKLTESEEGLLQTAFILVYMIMAPLYGYLGDRWNRRALMAFGVAIWSLTTLIGSFMETYHMFLLMRCFVGIGEASYSTIAPTIISDIFVDDMRSKMLALFYFAIPVGSGMGYIIGTGVAKIAGGFLPPGVDGEVASHAWRWGLRVTPAMGLVAVLLIVFLLKEPPRGQCENAQHLKPTSFCNDLKHLFTNRSYILSTLAFTCVTYVAGALAWWGTKYVQLGVIVQEHPNVTQDSVPNIFGVVAMVAGLIGVPLGSFAGQKLRGRYPYADPVVCGFGLIISLPLLIGAMVLVGVNSWAAFAVVLLGQIFLNLNWAVVSDIVLYIVLPTRRSSAEAFQILISHAFGDAGSPYVVGVVAEAFKPYINKSMSRELYGDSPYGVVGLTDESANVTQVALHNDVAAGLSVDPEKYIEFKALQYSLLICVSVELLAAVFFFASAIYVAADRTAVHRIITGEASEGSSSASSSEHLPQPTHRFVHRTDDDPSAPEEHRHRLLA